MIRVATANDAKVIASIYKPYVVETAVSFELTPPTNDVMKERIEQTLLHYPFLVLEEEERVKGYAYASAFTSSRPAYEHSAEVSIYLDQKSRGKGYGKKLYEELEKILKKQNVCTVYACIAMPSLEDDIYLDNSSFLFHKAVGFTLCGTFKMCGYKFNRWYNMVWMGKKIAEYKDLILPFIPFPDLEVNCL